MTKAGSLPSSAFCCTLSQVLRTPRTPSRLRGLSCSALLFPNVPPPETPERSSIRSGLECCLWPSPRHDRLGPPKRLSADNLSRLQRSPVVAARWFAPLSFKGFRHSARHGRISPLGWSLLPGAPALTRTGLAPARTTRLSGRTMEPLYYTEMFVLRTLPGLFQGCLALAADAVLQAVQGLHGGEALADARVGLAVFADGGEELAVLNLDAVH